MMDEMREKLMDFLFEGYQGWSHDPATENLLEQAKLDADEILSLETDTLRIAVVRKEGELPQIAPNSRDERIAAYWAQRDMLNAGFVQEEKDDLV